jgi:hypothetical protein
MELGAVEDIEVGRGLGGEVLELIARSGAWGCSSEKAIMDETKL